MADLGDNRGSFQAKNHALVGTLYPQMEDISKVTNERTLMVSI